MKQKPKKIKVTDINAPIPEFEVKDIEGTTYKDIFTSLDNEDQIGWLLSLMEEANEQIFRLQQQIDYLQEETGFSVDEIKILQLKDIWSEHNVNQYFEVDSATLRRGEKTGEWPKRYKRGGKVFYKLIDLKEMFLSKDGNLDNLNNYLKV